MKNRRVRFKDETINQCRRRYDTIERECTKLFGKLEEVIAKKQQQFQLRKSRKKDRQRELNFFLDLYNNENVRYSAPREKRRSKKKKRKNTKRCTERKRRSRTKQRSIKKKR
jgi:hypothetical protein